MFCSNCGSNIGGVVDSKKVAEEANNMPGVVYATDYIYMSKERLRMADV